MKKVPWGILAGILAIAVFFLSIGVFGAYFILDAIEAETSGHASLFGNWWQTLLFVMDILCLFGMLGSIALRIIYGKPQKWKKGDIVHESI